ncbi:uncharacterized protein NEMAJ01_1490 [Nematocida major]|uniref:uncharacterized protein n=1 Tax=Nematocida major TaxID=1912982 RepID=UPI0020086411|nr:uncharacterized protein NEMAJ01_1490 [Nematocida major]KAH9386594.1 hypothetical protein NEMAJ01_1490 [Nematocida major]
MQKRRYREEVLERRNPIEERLPTPERACEIAIKNARLLTKEELELITTKMPYGEYFRRYYEVALKEKIAKGLFDCIWYSERSMWLLKSHTDRFMEFRDFMANTQQSIRLDASNKEVLLQGELFEKYRAEEVDASAVVVLKCLRETTSVKELMQGIESAVHVDEWEMAQSEDRNEYRRTVYMRASVGADELKEKMGPDALANVIVTQRFLPTSISGKPVRETGRQFSDKYVMGETARQCKSILGRMSELFGVPDVSTTVASLEARVSPHEVGDLYVLALRKIFNFCYYCGLKYDCPYEMVLKCGLFHLRSTSVLDDSNPIEHAHRMKPFEIDRMGYLGGIPRSIDIRKFCSSKTREEIECRYCEKKFESMEFFEKHLERKNHHAYEAYVKQHAMLIECVSTLCYQLINNIEKRHKRIPNDVADLMFCKEEVPVKEVDYSNLDKKYPILEGYMPIMSEDFDGDEL